MTTDIEPNIEDFDFEPRPNVGHFAMAGIVIIGGLYLVEIGIAVLAYTWDPCSVVAFALYAPLGFCLTYWQYRAVFHRSRTAAKSISTLLMILASFGSFGFLMNLGEAVATEGLEAIGNYSPVLLVLSGITSSLWIAWFANWHWHRRLRQFECIGGVLHQREWRSGDLVVGMFAGIMVVGLAVNDIKTAAPQFAEHVAPDQAPVSLPKGAHDVCYCRVPRGTVAYEFQIDEAGFRRWVTTDIASRSPALAATAIESITGYTRITRYYHLNEKLSGPEEFGVFDGLSFEWTQEDHGVHATFDRSLQRAFYFSHSH